MLTGWNTFPLTAIQKGLRWQPSATGSACWWQVLAPYGWRIEGTGRLARLVEEPSEQAVIAKARELRASGLGYNAIARALSAEGLLSRTGTPFVAMQVSRWLRRNSDQPHQ